MPARVKRFLSHDSYSDWFAEGEPGRLGIMPGHAIVRS